MSSVTSPLPLAEEDEIYLPPFGRNEIDMRADNIDEQRRDGMQDLVHDVCNGDVLRVPRQVQVLRMLARKDDYGVLQADIGKVLGVSKGLVTRLKQQHEEHPEGTRRRPGRPSQLSDVFPELENFIAEETRARRAVTMGVLMAFITDILPTPQVTRRNVRTFMKRHKYAYKSTVPSDVTRVTLNADDMTEFYTRKLPEAVNGTHPSLVFNVDEMGAEMFADRKRVKVFVRQRDVEGNRPLEVGVPRTTRRCTLIACISLDGTMLCPAIITKTMTISSIVFVEGGYDTESLKMFHTEKFYE